jgi:hypothetical protein
VIRHLLPPIAAIVLAGCASATSGGPAGGGLGEGEGEGEAGGVGEGVADGGDPGESDGAGGGTPGGGDPGGDGGAEQGGDVGAPVLGVFGTECERASDCRGGQCVDSDEGKVCSRLCANEDDCPDGWLCVGDRRSGDDLVYICFPDRSSLCAPCQRSEDCLGQGSRCMGIGRGSYCARPCDSDRRPCPQNFDCRDILEGGEVVDRQCVPADNQCGECIDGDGDEYGIGPECIDDDCNDEDEDVHPNADEVCNQTDDDCDGTFDEAAIDLNLCGVCGDAPLEVCDGQDQDCDGEADENNDPVLPGRLKQDCSTACGQGQEQCLAGNWLNCSAPPSFPEVCGDGVDNNCDGIEVNRPDQYEPNNSCGSAANLGEDPDIVIRPSMDSVDDRFDHFWFRGKDNFTAGCAFGGGEEIEIDLRNPPPGVELRMRVFLEQPSCNAGLSEFRDGVRDCGGHPCFRFEEDCVVDEDGNYYIQVEKIGDGYNCDATYELRVKGLR